MRVLVPVDGSPVSHRILSVVDRLPRLRETEVVLAQVVAAPDPARPAGEVDEAVAHLARVADEVRRSGLRLEPFVLAGDPAEEVLRLARVVGPALLVMATHGEGDSSAARGAVAERVLERCPCPLLLCSRSALPLDPALGFRRILVPLDGTATSATILEPVEELAREHRSEVVLLHVDPYEDDRAGSLAELEGARARLAAAGVEVRTLAATGDPATAIVDAVRSEVVELLAMTSHSQGGAAKRWFGSVADAVIRHVDCPLLVVRVARPGA